MQPGVSRAIWMGIFGFIAGCLIVLVLRGLQSMDPLWDTGVALVLAAFMSAGFVMYGIGAFDSRASLHSAEQVEHAYEETQKETTEVLLTHTSLATTLMEMIKFLFNQGEAPKMGQPPIKAGFLGNMVIQVIWGIWSIGAGILQGLGILPYPEFLKRNNMTVSILLMITAALSALLLPGLIVPIVVGLVLLLAFPRFYPFDWIRWLVWWGWCIFCRVLCLVLMLPMVLLGGLLDTVNAIRRTLTMYGGAVWRAGAVTLILLLLIFAFAMWSPTGLTIVRTQDSNASFLANGYSTMTLPWGGELTIGGQPVIFTQFSLFAFFVIFTLASLGVAAGLLALLFYFLNKSMVEIRATPVSEEELTPPLPVREVGSFTGLVARALRALPGFLGNK